MLIVAYSKSRDTMFPVKCATLCTSDYQALHLPMPPPHGMKSYRNLWLIAHNEILLAGRIRIKTAGA